MRTGGRRVPWRKRFRGKPQHQAELAVVSCKRFNQDRLSVPRVITLLAVLNQR